MAIYAAGINVELHEVSLKNKPASLLQVSNKGTVPVLCTGEKVIDESLDIMRWALAINDPEGWLSNYSDNQKQQAEALIRENDQQFKPRLDKYKYADRHPDHSVEYYRQQCESFISSLEGRLQKRAYLLTDQISFVDVAIFPFIRQFSMVDKKWFDQSPYPALKTWLEAMLNLPLFAEVMAKRV
jgi:glutathione S-transferase